MTIREFEIDACHTLDGRTLWSVYCDSIYMGSWGTWADAR